MSAHVLLQNVGLTFHGHGPPREALRAISFEARPGEQVALLGPSGSGKTSLLRLLSGTLTKYAPAAHVEGEVSVRSDDRLSSNVISIAPQSGVLMPWRSALDNVLLPVEILSGRVSQGQRAKALSLLRVLGIDRFHEAKPYTLSGGIAQRVSLARALILDADLLLLDEPLNAVDTFERERIQTSLRSLISDRGTTTIHVTHDLYEAAFMADRIIILSRSPGTIQDIVEVSVCERAHDFRNSQVYHGLVAQLRALMSQTASANGDAVA